jgi:predicted aspartyl protease
VGLELLSNAGADDCKLIRFTSVDFTDSGSVIVPVSLENQQVPMAIDTGSPISAVDPVVAKKLGLIEERIAEDFLYNLAGESFTYVALPHDFGLGDMHSKWEGLVVWPSRMTHEGSIGGTISADILRHYDIDIDFGSHKLNVFSQDHCPGKVVYWTSDNVAVVPVHVLYPDGHIIVPVTLDGNSFHAVLDTGSSESFLSQEAAPNTFGLDPTSPGMSKISDHGGPGGVAVYHHSFKNLGFEGVSVGNPTISIFDNMAQNHEAGASHLGSRFSSLSGQEYQLTLGLNELRHLHLYIAYKEQKLYITPATAPVAVAAITAPAAVPPVSSAFPDRADPGSHPLRQRRLPQLGLSTPPPAATSGAAAWH